jgi:hypothetical protein
VKDKAEQRVPDESTLLDIWKLRWLRRPFVASLVLFSAVTGGLASFTSSLDTMGTFLEKRLGWKGFGHQAPHLPKVMSQSAEDCVRPDRNCRVELWLQNPYDKPIYITAVSFRVLEVFNEPILGTVEPSAIYPIDLTGIERTGMARRRLLYQEIGAGKSDRFVLLFGARDLHDRFRRWRLEAKLETSAGALPIQPLTIHLPWDSAYSSGPPVALPTPLDH